ncbi:hypothetical protein GCM10022223_33120 [Kineosporia mesophila]|uniref:Uncharacterized protein n=1 Tax=Kineosporia mesophila TaxID=566012 RepID=A0ABP6ZT05_9ACTN
MPAHGNRELVLASDAGQGDLAEYLVTSGTFPSHSGEIAVSRAMARDWDLCLGSTCPRPGRARPTRLPGRGHHHDVPDGRGAYPGVRLTAGPDL